MPAIGPQWQKSTSAWEASPTFNATGTTTSSAISVAASFDGGATFGTVNTITNINSNFFNVPVGDNPSSLLDEPWIAVDTASSTTRAESMLDVQQLYQPCLVTWDRDLS